VTWPPDRDILSPASEAEHETVRIAQRALGLEPTGLLDEATQAQLRGVQRLFRHPVTGVLDRSTAALIERLRHVYKEDEK
jgi:hypothetical protein